VPRLPDDERERIARWLVHHLHGWQGLGRDMLPPEDQLQEAHIAILEAEATFHYEPGGALGGWVVWKAPRVLIDRGRRAGRLHHPSRPPGEHAHGIRWASSIVGWADEDEWLAENERSAQRLADPDAEAAFARRDAELDARAMMPRLAAAARQHRAVRVLLQVAATGKPMRVVADELGISESRVSQLCARGRAVLREELHLAA